MWQRIQTTFLLPSQYFPYITRGFKRTNEPQRTSAGRLPTQFSQNTNFSYRYVPTSKDFTYTRVLFTLFRNVMNYRNLRVMYVSVIYRHETHLCSILIHYTMHVIARKQCILCYALRRKSYLTLPYVTSLRDSFCLGSFAHGFIMLPPRSLASSLGCSLAIILRDRLQHGSWEGDCTYIRTSINFVVRNGFTCRLFLEWNAPRSQFTTCPRKC